MPTKLIRKAEDDYKELSSLKFKKIINKNSRRAY